MDGDPGLRERKKRQTRQLISDVASSLFLTKGFDNVTVTEIAEAVNVSPKTVFNYFPRKEDLFLDRLPEALDLITGAVRDRPPDVEPLTALRRLFVGLVRQGHPLGGVGEGYDAFWRVVAGSPALLARVRESVQETESVLAAALAEAAGADPGDPWQKMTAAFVVTVYRTTYAESARRLIAGDPAAEVAEDHVALLERGFDALERAVEGR
ncbi:TetR family transcriptional regulator [Sphaerisporangium krabiense]|uniref:AcrR family transcriptional regulator n=1 Tax=Sphaerisporangium krabiense TaxID=763782 RepID=A0A7W8Z414_9ACTN|nr:TetR/AcrR family transcriptional regulator [Sphaerisporangium krabiense]MBB5627020.1 AcrR family transcriptional regulator [Sphaerisporangium krabiense]GII65174.1 TetR family transcriptional regulator [Sphaerisporangium krabiense]